MPALATQLPPPGPKQVIAAAKVGGGAATSANDPTLISGPAVRVNAVATAADSVTLPNTQGGDQILIQNQGAAALAVFGWGGATINGTASVSQGAGLGALYVASLEGTWTRFLQG